MHSRRLAVLGLFLAAGLATACADSTAPSTTPAATAAAKGAGGGGGSGGGGGGGGAAKVGRIDAVSGAANCDAGTTIGIGLKRGFNDRIEMTTTWVGALLPGSTTETSLGGWWNTRLVVDATGALITGFGSGVGMTTPSRQVTILGGSVAPGVYTLSFTAIKLQLDPLTFLAVPGSPILETCTAALTVVAR